jgi:hypothetical protein
VTILAELAGSVTVLDDGTPSLLGDVEVTDDGAFWFVLDVDARASVAFAQRFQQLGVGIMLDGVAIPDREIGNVLTITESADSYGDQLTFQLIGARFSPFARAHLRSMARVEVSFVTGNTANEFRKKVFTGYVVAFTFNDRNEADITCLDAAALHAQKRAKTWTLPANSGRTFLSIGLELLALCDIPVGHIDLGGNGGIARKAMAPGDQPVLDYIRDIWAKTGAEIDFEDDKLCARRYSPTLPPVLDLHAGNLLASSGGAAIGLTSPETLAANVLGVVSTSYTEGDTNGQHVVVHRVETFGEYARKGVTETSAVYRKIGEVITRTTYRGTLDVLTDVEEWGFYSPQASGTRIQESGEPPGYEIVDRLVFGGSVVYTYTDGSTHADPYETFRVIRRSVDSKRLDSELRAIGQRSEESKYAFRRKAIWEGGSESTLSNPPTYLNDAGEGVTNFKEEFGVAELIDAEYSLAANGTIEAELERHHYRDIGAPRMNATGAFGYGVDTVTWTSRASEGPSAFDGGGLRIVERRYFVRDEDRYSVSERTTHSDGTAARTVRSSMTGAPPRPEQVQPEVFTQEIRAIVEDRARIAMAGQEIESIVHDEYVETPEEAAAYAKVLARRASAITLTCEVAIESLAHKFRVVRVNLPGSSIDGLLFYVREVTRDAATFREGIVAEYYAPELG